MGALQDGCLICAPLGGWMVTGKDGSGWYCTSPDGTPLRPTFVYDMNLLYSIYTY